MYFPFELEDGTIEVDIAEDKVLLLLHRMGNYKYVIGALFLILVYCCFYTVYRLEKGKGKTK